VWLTRVVVPVSYRRVGPGLPQASPRPGGPEARFVEPLPDAGTVDVVEVVEFRNRRGGEEEIYDIADGMNREFGSLITVVKAAEMLGLVESPGERVVLTAKGKRFAEAGPDDRRALWREQLLQLGLFRD